MTTELLYKICRQDAGVRTLCTWYCYFVGTISPKKFLWLTEYDISDMNADAATKGSSARILFYLYDKELADQTLLQLSEAQPSHTFTLLAANSKHSF